MKKITFALVTVMTMLTPAMLFAAAGHDNLREQSAFSKSISGQILGKYAQHKQLNDRANSMHKMTPSARQKLMKARSYGGGSSVYDAWGLGLQ